MIVAQVLEPQSFRSWGAQWFVQLPSPGDNLILQNDKGEMDVVRVRHLQHELVRASAPQGSPPPTVTVIVEWVRSLGRKP
jgi:hypothetical protein